MTERRFSLDDQQQFAALSGDHNPIHLDAVAARRLMLGGVAVHGINMLLWSIESLARQIPLNGFAKLRVNFDRGLMVGDAARCEWRPQGTSYIGRVTTAMGVVMRATIEPLPIALTAWSGATELPPGSCLENDIGDLATRHGILPLSLPLSWQKMFPALAQSFSPEIVATLLATTRLVGMQCPGLHSVYSALRLDRIAPPAPPTTTLAYKVIRADSRVRLVDIGVEAGSYRGTIGTLVRPKPVQQLDFPALAGLIEPRQFSHQRALVIGGSRGLGELAAKLLAVGGADVTITWHRGETEAQQLVSAAQRQGLKLRSHRFDVSAPPGEQTPPFAPFTHLFYFATPHIRRGASGCFNAELFSQFLEYYVTGFSSTVSWFAPRANRDACVWYPSTVFISEPNQDFAEYCAAKECGEALCRTLARQLAPMRFLAPRIPRLLTDQTQSLATEALPDAVSVLRENLMSC